MSFFKKKQFRDVDGYERISRLIEDRQQEGDDTGEEDGLDEDTVLLTPQSRAAAQPAAASHAPPPPSSVPETVSMRRQDFTSGPTPVPSIPAMPAYEPQAQAQPSAQPAPPRAEPIPSFVQPPAPAVPRMQAPEMPLATAAVSLVSKDAVWDGKLNATGDVRIEGRLEGEVQTTGTLFVAAEARVQGTIRARNVMLAGDIEGQLRCEERLEILPGGSARGEIDTGTLVVHEGAFIESKFQMRREGAVQR